MQERTRTTILVSLCLFFLALMGLWWYFGFSLDFMRFFAAEPVATLQPTPTCRPLPQCLLPGADPACSLTEPPEGWCLSVASARVTCLPGKQLVAVGVPAILKGSGGNGVYEWFAPVGAPAAGTGGTFSVSYDTPGTKQVTVQSARAGVQGNPTILDSVACTVVVTP